MSIGPSSLSSPDFIETERGARPSEGKREACYGCLTIRIKRPMNSGISAQMTIRPAVASHGDLARGQSVDPVLTVSAAEARPTERHRQGLSHSNGTSLQTSLHRLELSAQQPRLRSPRRLCLRRPIMGVAVRGNPNHRFGQKSLSCAQERI